MCGEQIESQEPSKKPKKKELKRKYTPKTLKVLFALSGNRCGKPDCPEHVIKLATEISDDLVVAQIAHIYALSEDGPRGKKGLTEAELNAPKNLILLCPTHHIVVDGQHESYPASDLIAWKAKQERKASEPIGRSIRDIGYVELDFAARALTNVSTNAPASTLRTIPLKDKMERNGLGGASEMLLSMGMAKSHEVAEVLVKIEQLNTGFPDLLRDGFINYYTKAKASGLAGDHLFFEMYDWAGGGTGDPVRMAAGLCILTHLFVLCDVFEK